MSDKRKYIILYGQNYCEELYSFAKNLTEAKDHIKDCMQENSMPLDEITCMEVKERCVTSKIKISIK